MSRTLVVALCATLLIPSCKKKSRTDATPPAPAADAGAVSKIPSPQAPDLGYEARRAELLKRGDPAMMQPAPVHDDKVPEQTAADLVKAVSKDVLMVGTIRVDLAKGTAEVPAKVVVVGAPLEYIIVSQWGKSYESMLSVAATVVELRLALTLLGYEGTMPDASGKVAAPTAGDTVTAALRIDGKEKPLSSFLIDRRAKKALAEAPWQVIGFRDNERTVALRTQELMTLVPRDYLAPLRIAIDVGNVYAGPDHGVVADPKKLPAVGSDVTLVLARRVDAPPPKAPSPSLGAETP